MPIRKADHGRVTKIEPAPKKQEKTPTAPKAKPVAPAVKKEVKTAPSSAPVSVKPKTATGIIVK